MSGAPPQYSSLRAKTTSESQYSPSPLLGSSEEHDVSLARETYLKGPVPIGALIPPRGVRPPAHVTVTAGDTPAGVVTSPVPFQICLADKGYVVLFGRPQQWRW